MRLASAFGLTLLPSHFLPFLLFQGLTWRNRIHITLLSLFANDSWYNWFWSSSPSSSFTSSSSKFGKRCPFLPERWIAEASWHSWPFLVPCRAFSLGRFVLWWTRRRRRSRATPYLLLYLRRKARLHPLGRSYSIVRKFRGFFLMSLAFLSCFMSYVNSSRPTKCSPNFFKFLFTSRIESKSILITKVKMTLAALPQNEIHLSKIALFSDIVPKQFHWNLAHGY